MRSGRAPQRMSISSAELIGGRGVEAGGEVAQLSLQLDAHRVALALAQGSLEVDRRRDEHQPDHHR